MKNKKATVLCRRFSVVFKYIKYLYYDFRRRIDLPPFFRYGCRFLSFLAELIWRRHGCRFVVTVVAFYRFLPNLFSVAMVVVFIDMVAVFVIIPAVVFVVTVGFFDPAAFETEVEPAFDSEFVPEDREDLQRNGQKENKETVFDGRGEQNS